MRNIGTTVHVKGDFLIGLGQEWYRVDTDFGFSARFIAPARVYRRRSSAKSVSRGSRARISIARPASTSTSQGRGRVL